MKNFIKRPNGKGTAKFLNNTKNKPWRARITIGKDFEGKIISYDIGKFDTELEALVCLENYHNNPTPLYIKEEKYNRIAFFPPNPYPLVSVSNPNKTIAEKLKKDNYTFKELFEKFKEIKMLTKEEDLIEKKYHIRPKDKPFGRHYCRTMVTAFNNCKELYDIVYKDLRTSDFMKQLKNSNKSIDSQRQMVNLFNNLDKFALQEDIINKGYSQFITISTTNRKEIQRNKNQAVSRDKLFSYEQINYLWNFEIKSKGLKEHLKKEHELFIRDFWLMLLYTGCRADELLSIYNANIFLDKNYFIGGLKTQAGINREIPIHPKIKPIIEKYYNPNKEFLFYQNNGNKIDYDYYLYHFKFNFKNLHPFVSMHTAHDCRHTLRNELRKIGVQDIIINSIIGHSNNDVGQDIYSHVSIEEKIEAINLIKYEKQKLIILKKEA